MDSNINFAQYFDHSLLRPNATREDFVTLCNESMEYGFKMVAINPAAVILCKNLLKGSSVLVGAAIGFPLGQHTLNTKLYETKDAIQNGADEIDYVINIMELKSCMTQKYEFIKNEMRQIVDECKKSNVISKVIFENCYLTEAEKEALCRIALEVKPDFIKTSTGFGTDGATLADIKLMKSIVGDAVQIKASGGIRTLEDAENMINEGITRIGTSSTVKIMNERKTKW